MSFKNFDFVGKSRFFYILSIAITILGLVFLLTRGLNYGVDFQSGSNVDISLSKTLTTEQIDTVLEEAGIGEDASITPGNDRVNIRFREVLTEDQDMKMRTGIEKLDERLLSRSTRWTPKWQRAGPKRNLCRIDLLYRNYHLCQHPL